MYAHCITSRKNICLTLAKKYELKFAHYLLNRDNSMLTFTFDEKDKIQSNYQRIIIDKLNTSETNLEYYASVSYNKIDFKRKNYVQVYNQNPKFYLILEIIINKNQQVLLFCQKVYKTEYHSHFIAYEINQQLLGELEVIPITEVIGPPLTLIKTTKGKTMLRPKEYFRICF